MPFAAIFAVEAAARNRTGCTAGFRTFERDGERTEFDLIAKPSANLLRMWAED